MNEFTVITPTGDRPEVFELCCKYVLRQSILPTQWIIIDDGVVPTQVPDKRFIHYIRREPDPNYRFHTLPIQMLEAVKHVKHEKIIIVEDDDWYCPTYFEQVLKMFDSPRRPILVGQGQAVYYHVPKQKHYTHENKEHASWCQTAFRSDFIDYITKTCKQYLIKKNPFIDMRLWKYPITKYLLLDSKPFCIGMKGLPGRLGGGSGHRSLGGFNQDVEMTFLRQCIGNDFELYKKFMIDKR